MTLLWLQAGSCGGCTMSVLENGAQGWARELRSFGIELLWHPSLSEESGAEAVDILEAVSEGRTPLDFLCIEGSVLRGPNGTGLFNRLGGTGRTMFDWIRRLAPRARHCIAVGTCASYGGIHAAAPDPIEACGLQYEGSEVGGALSADYRSLSGLPVINVAGCAPHPGWIMETIVALQMGDFDERDLDLLGRPKFYTKTLAHHGCERNEYYEFKASAEKFSDLGCMMEHLGCKATQAAGDCNQRGWNGSGSCTHGGFSCVACTEPAFEDQTGFLETPKIGGIPVGLPRDMPKAWFVALAALSKSATPDRVRENATSDRVVLDTRRNKDVGA
ncbi:HupU protein [Rhizobium sp. YTU87027]|uniref:NADH-quinone oxidoreductase subunit B family protein n=2 Tax=Rhizobium/Agrobacterium group TaxID=227290 RepID=UPI003D683910